MRNLTVNTDLVGLFHEFQFDEKRVRIQLPSAKYLPGEDGEGEKLSCNSWREVDGKQVPTKYWVHEVDVTILLPKPISIPEEVLSRHPNAYDIYSQDEQNYLDEIANKYGELAEKAFDLWIRVLRWKCNNSSIGRPEIHGSRSGWSTYLIHEDISQGVWASNDVLIVKGSKPVTSLEWQAVETAMQANDMPPIYFELMFDGIEHLENEDLQRAVVDFAVACESCLKGFVAQSLPKELNDAFKKHLNRENIYTVREKFIPALLSPNQKAVFSKIKSTLDSLFTDRNKILHSGSTDQLTREKCKEYLEVTQKVIELINGL